MYKRNLAKILVNKSIILCKKSVKNRESYITNTPAKRLLDRVCLEYPEVDVGNKINMFYRMFDNSFTVTEYGLDFELNSINYKNINLFILFKEIRTVLHAILRVAYINNHKDFTTFYNLNNYDADNFVAYTKYLQSIEC